MHDMLVKQSDEERARELNWRKVEGGGGEKRRELHTLRKIVRAEILSCVHPHAS